MKGIRPDLRKIYLSQPHMSGKEKKYIYDEFFSNSCTKLNRTVELFEKAIKDFTKAEEVIATSNVTSAIHLALLRADVNPGDLVICQSLTFPGSANPIRYLGATPVFVDSEKTTWNMDPSALEDSIKACINGKLPNFSLSTKFNDIQKKLPKAIIVTHLYGMPANMDEINRIAKKYGILVIENSAEALGSSYKGINCGILGDLGIISFNEDKIITTGNGGALLCRETKGLKSPQKRSSFSSTFNPESSSIPYNYCLPIISASVGIAQMEVLQERIAKRREIFAVYKYFLFDNPSITFLEENGDFFSNHWLTTILIDPSKNINGVCKDKISLHLSSLGIESRSFWRPLHLQPLFKEFPFFGTKLSEKLFIQGICLPSGSLLKLNDVYFISEEINKLTLN